MVGRQNYEVGIRVKVKIFLKFGNGSCLGSPFAKGIKLSIELRETNYSVQ